MCFLKAANDYSETRFTAELSPHVWSQVTFYFSKIHLEIERVTLTYVNPPPRIVSLKVQIDIADDDQCAQSNM